MGINRKACIFLAAGLLLFAYSCKKVDEGKTDNRPERLKVVASLFPMYDFARVIGGEHAAVTLLLPPGMEPHSFEPRPADIAALNNADVFIYTNQYMEPWAEEIITGMDRGRLLVVNASEGVRFLKGPGGETGLRKSEQRHDHGHGADPHIWLDFGNARKIVDTIARSFSEKDPSHSNVYMTNAEGYKARLNELDGKYRGALSGCRKRVFINGGHYIFGYLAERYGLRYRAAYGFSPDAEPTARDLAEISRMLREEGLNHIFYEELLSPRIAETLAKETGAALLKLHGAHNISREELASGTSFLDLMEKNLENLVQGLQCR
jgi:zinc transport system substrate-binding protein